MTNRYWKCRIDEIPLHDAYCWITKEKCIDPSGFCSQCPIERGE